MSEQFRDESILASGSEQGDMHASLTRHAKSARHGTPEDPLSESYPSLTETGSRQLREKARGEFLEMIRNAPEGSVIFIGGASDQMRTKDTARGYGDELLEWQQESGDESIVVITKDSIEKMIRDTSEEEKSIGGTIARIRSVIESHPGKKVVVDYPLEIKQLAYKYHDRWTTADGKKTEYFDLLLKKHNQDHESAGLDWLENQGRLEVEDPDGSTRALQGPLPEDVAKDYLEGLRRLDAFAKRHVPERPVVAVGVGHQWDEDALVTYLGNNGVVDMQGFRRVTGGDISRETELVEFVVDPKTNKTSVLYRGKKFEGKLSRKVK